MSNLKIVKGVPPTPPTDTSTGLAVLGCLTVIAVLILSPVLDGLALSVLWGWFVVKLFGLPAIGKAAAIGLALTAKAFTGTHMLKQAHENKPGSVTEAIGSVVGLTLGNPLGLLLMGWLITLFM